MGFFLFILLLGLYYLPLARWALALATIRNIPWEQHFSLAAGMRDAPFGVSFGEGNPSGGQGGQGGLGGVGWGGSVKRG